MTKNEKHRKKEQGAGDFHNRPFNTLKGVTAKAPSQAVSPPTAPARETEEHDDELFLRAMGGARRIDTEQEQVQGLKAPGAESLQARDDDENNNDLFLQAMGALKTTTIRDEDSEPADEGPSRSPSSRMRQLKRGTLHIGDELDLHGFLKEDALKRLQHFIAGAYARGLQAVLVITGKGTNSTDGPVLPGAVAAWLREQGRGMVVEFLPAPRDKGGTGAIVAFLRRRDGK